MCELYGTGIFHAELLPWIPAINILLDVSVQKRTDVSGVFFQYILDSPLSSFSYYA